MSLIISMRHSRIPKNLIHVKRTTNFPMAERSLSAMNASSALKFYSHLNKLGMNLRVYISTAMIQSLSAIMTSVKTYSKTLFYLVGLPSSREWENVCGKNYINQLLLLIKLRSWHLLKEITQYGLVVPFSLLYQLSRQCGSISRNTTRTVQQSFIASASEQLISES